MLVGTLHPTTEEEAYSLYIDAIHEQLRTTKGFIFVFKPLKWMNSLQEKALESTLIELGYYRTSKNWVFQHGGYYIELPVSFTLLPAAVAAKKLAHIGLVTTNQKYTRRERTNALVDFKEETSAARGTGSNYP